ncbi:MAG: CheR family methyltransferase [Myxococcaceae bacterium]
MSKKNDSPIITTPKIDNNDLLQKIFLLLKKQTGHDFSKYKLNTLYRRIERRLSLHKINALNAYVEYLEKTPNELKELFNDLLIGVTSFFRDPQTFVALEQLIAQKLLKDRESDSTIRIWVAGCSTGEEAYSIGMLLMEQMAITGKYFKVLIFASDIDPHAIAMARRGIYSADISTSVSKARLERFFIHESKHYEIKKELRDLVIFSLHDINRDPPFSKVDLISCRNLLIYFTPELQKKLLPIFHYALNPDSILFLGMSESIGGYDDLFSIVDHKAKIYLSAHSSEKTYKHQLLAQHEWLDSKMNHLDKTLEIKQKTSLRELTEQTLLREFFPATVLVNNQGDVLYLRGSTGKFLEPAQGDTGVSNIFMMAREGLRYSLEMTLNKAVKTKETSSLKKLHIQTSDQLIEADLTVFPVSTDLDKSSSSWLYLILLVEVAQTDKVRKNTNQEILHLHTELKSRDEYIFNLRNELENFSSDQRCIHEEMQSVNEEFQSTNEELETSREELQSLNEELSTVNSELQLNLSGLSRVNNDMNNLISGTGIGTVFVDHQLHILRFTPAVAKIINLIKTDLGRPLTDIATSLVDYHKMAQETQRVLDSLIPCEVEVSTMEGLHYLMRIQPYRTLEHVIEGAVISFIDITEQKKLEVALQEANALLRLAVRDAQDLNSHNLKS